MHTIILMKQDDKNTDPMITNDDRQHPVEYRFSFDIIEDLDQKRGVVAVAGLRKFGNGVCPITVSARLGFFGGETFLNSSALSPHSTPRCRSSCWPKHQKSMNNRLLESDLVPA